MAVYRSGAGDVHDELKTIIIPNTKENIILLTVASQKRRLRSQPEGFSSKDRNFRIDHTLYI